MVDTINQTDKAWLLDIQRKLYTWSRVHPEGAWRDMWNWMIQPQNLRLAWRRVASNHGARTAGVDGLTVRQIEHRIGVERFLTDLQRSLRDGSYRPQPVKRVLIPKAGKPGQHRPLGVPTVEDRVVQAAILHLLEPIFEARFYDVSFGFRPKRAVRKYLSARAYADVGGKLPQNLLRAEGVRNGGHDGEAGARGAVGAAA